MYIGIYKLQNCTFLLGLWRFWTWGTQLIASSPSACARRSQGSRGLAPWRGLQRGSAPLQENFVFGKLNMHNFRSFLVQITKIYDFLFVVASLMGQLSFSWENMYFWNHKCTFSVSFLSKFINKYKCGGCKGAAPPCLRKFCI